MKSLTKTYFAKKSLERIIFTYAKKSSKVVRVKR